MTIFKGWRTILVNTLMLLPLLFEMAMNVLVSPEFGALIPDEHKDLYGVAIVLANYWLRYITTTRIGESR